MAVGRRDLTAVGIVVHRCECVQEAPHACAQERHYRRTHGPERSGLVGVIALAPVDHGERKQHHHEEWQGFQCGKHRAQPQPVLRWPDPEEVVAGADDAGNQRHGNDHVQPLFNHFPVDTGNLDQHVGQNGAHDQFPYAFNPQVYHEPPEVFVGGQVAGVVEGEHPEYGQADQAGDQHNVDHGFAALQGGHQDVEQEADHHQGYAYLGNRGLFKELPAHGWQQFVHGDIRQSGVIHKQVTKNGECAGSGKNPEQDPRKQRAV